MRPSVRIQKYRLFLSHSVYLRHLIAVSVHVSLSACCRQLVWVVWVVRVRLVWPPVPCSSVHHFVSCGQPVHGQHHGEPSLCFGLQLYTRWDQPAPPGTGELSRHFRSCHVTVLSRIPLCRAESWNRTCLLSAKACWSVNVEMMLADLVSTKICLMAPSAVELSFLSPPGTLVSHCHSILQVPPVLLGSRLQEWI